MKAPKPTFKAGILTVGAVAALLITSCGDTGPTQAQRAAADAQAAKAAAAKVAAAAHRVAEITQGHAYAVAFLIPEADLRNQLGLGVYQDSQDIFKTGVYAKAAPGELAPAPDCLKDIDTRTRAAYAAVVKGVEDWLAAEAHVNPNLPGTQWDQPWFDQRSAASDAMSQGYHDVEALQGELGGQWCVWMT